MDSDLHDTLEACAVSMTPGQQDLYEREALAYLRSNPGASDADLLSIMERVQAG